ncbi:MFS transporter [Hydrogenophaga sp.]|uniref:MFS transporter n=1 Tax=Hydrogenophaga sp. TaxID=1904254 RepID=UPI0025C4F8A4|nr:MFS transporter [Hydrogenophaga sp.]MBT9464612.1 MFS transporter [Hydrogenophaga sp.]
MTPPSVPRTVLLAVMVGHFMAAFAALGMPPFFALILEQSLNSEAHHLVGWFYVVPIAFAALSSPWWGRLADRYGKKKLLIRAQLGLAASFLLAGFATDIWVFFAALALQGLLGGTFAASNAYLATIASGSTLSDGMSALQWSARAALVVAPLTLGLALQAAESSPIEMYRWLALLPLAALALALWLPTGNAAHEMSVVHKAVELVEAKPRQVFALQFTFVFATVVTFPYFVPYVQQRFVGLSTGIAGLLFGLPHAVYLLAALPLTRWLAHRRRTVILAAAFAALALCLVGQALSGSLGALIGWRVVMGLAMTAGFIALHRLIAGAVHCSSAGRAFGWFESSSKWGAVAAGLSAGFVAQTFGLGTPFFLGAAMVACAAAYLTLATRHRLRPSS